MKGAVLALFCAVALVHAEINENGCPVNPYIDVLKPHPNCNKYYQCLQGELFERKCASTLVFNVETQECDWAENVDCENRTPIAPEGSEEESQPENGNGHDNPSLAPEICAEEGSDGTLVAHENCNQFYECNDGVPVAHRCASTLLFNPATNQCDWPDNVNCGDRNPDGGNGGEDGGNGDGGNGDNGNGDGDSEDGGNGDSSGGGNSDPSQAAEICAAEGSDGVLVAHENCNQFYKCNGGVPVTFSCWGNLLFNPANDQCDWPENVNCGDRNPDGGNGGGDGGNGGGDGGNGGGDGGNGDGSAEDGGNGDGGNSDPSQVHEICAAEESDGILVAHENCNKFYECNNGVPVTHRCASTLLFNPAINRCDWPDNVNCGDRNPDGGNGGGDGGNGDGGNGDGGNGDGGNGDGGSGGNGGGNDNPSEAPKICAAEGSDGVLVAHENCNQFYKCNGGVPVALKCWGNLLFNPATDECDWPENVDCSNRNPDGGNGGGDGGNGDGGNGDGGSGGSGGGNDNPSEAPKICAAEDSEGVLVAHENCNKFYMCNGGKPVTLKCWGDLLFNPAINECDWPHNVNCEDRNPDNGGEDNGNGDGDHEDGNGGGHGDPSLAPEICAAEESDGVLVAHEDCNKYYICSDGKPLTRSCYGDLHFNPSKDSCDWPQNVDCGNRRTFTSFNKHMPQVRRM